MFEAFDTSPENPRSLLGGGRYDGLVALFGVEAIPTSGFAVGDVGFMNFLQTHKLVKLQKPKTDILVLKRESNTANDIRSTVDELREMGARVAVDFSDRKLDKQFKTALKTGIRYIVFLDNENQNSPHYVLKDTKTGKEEKHSLQRIVSIVKDSRKV